MGEVCLIILFNHRFDANIERLEKHYQDRFSNRYYLVPFYDGDRENVIPVYECSFQYQGYFAQGFSRFFHEKFEHYLVVADDMLIDPQINEKNYREYFHLESDTGYITDFYPLVQWSGGFERIENALLADTQYLGVNAKEELPSKEEAFAIAAAKGFWNFRFAKKMAFNSSFRYNWNYWSSRSRIHLLGRVLLGITNELNYPFMCAYSDICIISRSAIKEFCRICGIFAALRLHVETALPTALLLSQDKILTNEQLGKKARLVWNRQERGVIGEQNHWQIRSLMEHWEENTVCMHPVKFSQWSD